MSLNNLNGKTLLITGASRGIGKAIALRAARDGANIIVTGKTNEPHSKLPGTVWSAVDDIRDAGGRAIGIICDIRFEEQVQAAVDAGVKEFGGIDIVVNNASAISLTPTAETAMKRFDLMFDVNVRGTFMTSKLALPYLKESANPHILVLSPPLNMDNKWFKSTLAYTMSKYGMSMCVLGMSEEFKEFGIAVNALWPRTAIATTAVKNLLGGDEMVRRSRKPEIVADAAWCILTSESRKNTGNFYLDDDVLSANGIHDLSRYAVEPGTPMQRDFFLDGEGDIKEK